jgi:hypothetical protein
MKSSSLSSFVGAVTVFASASAQVPCPSCSPCNTAPIIETGSVGPQSPSGNGTYPSLRAPTFDASLGTLTGVQITVTAYAEDRVFKVENTDPIAPGSTRSYQTYYRDLDLAGCTPPNTWNVSSGVTVAW